MYKMSKIHLQTGIGATILGLCDLIYASESAYFYTPFTALGLCIENK